MGCVSAKWWNLQGEGAYYRRSYPVYNVSCIHVYMYCDKYNKSKLILGAPKLFPRQFHSSHKVGCHNVSLLLKRTVWSNSKVMRFLQSSLLLDLLNVYFFDKTAVWTLFKLKGPRILFWKCWHYKLVFK